MNDAREVYMIGGGGHGKVILACLEELGIQCSGIYDDDTQKHWSEVLGVRVIGPIDAIRRDAPGATYILALGANRSRQALDQRLAGLVWATIVHPRAWVHRSVHLAPGTVVFAGAIIQPETIIGRHAIINTGASLDHECTLGDFVHIGPGCRLGGAVRIGDGAFLGIGTSVIPGVSIGSWSQIGAGGTVVNPIPDRVLAVGTPAREIRAL